MAVILGFVGGVEAPPLPNPSPARGEGLSAMHVQAIFAAAALKAPLPLRKSGSVQCMSKQFLRLQF